MFVPPNFAVSIVFVFSWDHCKFQGKLETMLMQKFWGTNNEYYGIFRSGLLLTFFVHLQKQLDATLYFLSFKCYVYSTAPLANRMSESPLIYLWSSRVEEKNNRQRDDLSRAIFMINVGPWQMQNCIISILWVRFL